jgi:hypothetical protein
MPGYIRKGGKTMKKKNTGKHGKKNTCKRRRVRISANGSYNKSDMKHNKKCERKHKQKSTRKRRGGNPDEREQEVSGILGNILPPHVARNIGHLERIIPRQFDFSSMKPKWRREDEFTDYHQNPKNIGLGFPFSAEQVVRNYADGFRNSEVRPDGLEKTLPGTTKEWYMLLPKGGWGNYPHERKGPFSANEIGDSIFTNTRLVDRSIPEKDWRPQTLSAYMRGEGRSEGPRTTLGVNATVASQSLRTERNKFKRGWHSGGGKRKTRKRKGGNDEERKKQVEELIKQWKPVKGKGSLPDTAANLTAKQTVELEKKEREERELQEWIRREEEERLEAEEEWRNKKYNAWVLGI